MNEHQNRKDQVKTLTKGVRSIPTYVALALIMAYRMLISPLLPSSCRFLPTCSEYGLQAFKRFGFCKGFVLTTKRILRCRPGGPYGYDPVPEVYPRKERNQEMDT